MINIAICDDDVVLTENVERLLREIAAEENISIRCEAFYDGSALIESVLDQKIYFDLVYLDIEMKAMDGIHAAQSLRDIHIPTLIIYMSSHEEYLKELFSTEPFRFLSKPIDREEFRVFFLSACERIQKRAGYFMFSYKKTFYKIPFDRIAYFESSGRIIIIHLAEMENVELEADMKRFYGKMNDLEKQIASVNNRFLRIHQSFLVNYDYVMSISFGSVVMMDGKELQISEDRQKSMKAQFNALLTSEEKGYDQQQDI